MDNMSKLSSRFELKSHIIDQHLKLDLNKDQLNSLSYLLESLDLQESDIKNRFMTHEGEVLEHLGQHLSNQKLDTYFDLILDYIDHSCAGFEHRYQVHKSLFSE